MEIAFYYMLPIEHKFEAIACFTLCCRGGRYSEGDAKVIIVQILSVVAFCHLQGVVHRDLKPEVLFPFCFLFPYFLILL